MRRLVIWSLMGTASVALTILVFLPATWLAALVEKQTAGRLTLGDAHGTLWRGSAFICGAPSESQALTPLVPGRFSWQLSPAVLLGKVDAVLENGTEMSAPVKVTGTWHQWQVSPGAILLPMGRLAALGAPLNTVQPSGQMRFSWEPLQLTRLNGNIEIVGAMNLAINDLGSRLSPIKPLGSYDLALEYHGTSASVTLKTVNGPMLLSGSGTIAEGRLQFSGTAQSAPGADERLANFINLLGQRRKDGDKEVIALELK